MSWWIYLRQSLLVPKKLLLSEFGIFLVKDLMTVKCEFELKGKWWIISLFLHPNQSKKRKHYITQIFVLVPADAGSCSVHWSPSFTSIIALALSTAARQATGPRVAEVMWVFSAYFMSKYWYFYFLGTYKWLFKVPKGPWNLPLILWIFLNFGHLGVHHSSDPLLGIFNELSAVNEARWNGTGQNWFCPEKNQLTGIFSELSE